MIEGISIGADRPSVEQAETCEWTQLGGFVFSPHPNARCDRDERLLKYVPFCQVCGGRIQVKEE